MVLKGGIHIKLDEILEDLSKHKKVCDVPFKTPMLFDGRRVILTIVPVAPETTYLPDNLVVTDQGAVTPYSEVGRLIGQSIVGKVVFCTTASW